MNPNPTSGNERPYSHTAKNEKGEPIVSDNNREGAIAFYFDKAEIIYDEVKSCVECSMLSEASQELILQALSKELDKIKEEASSLAKSYRDKNQIRMGIVVSVEKIKDVIPEDDKQELFDVVKAVNSTIWSMTEGDKVYDYIIERNMRK